MRFCFFEISSITTFAIFFLSDVPCSLSFCGCQLYQSKRNVLATFCLVFGAVPVVAYDDLLYNSHLLTLLLLLTVLLLYVDELQIFPFLDLRHRCAKPRNLKVELNSRSLLTGLLNLKSTMQVLPG